MSNAVRRHAGAALVVAPYPFLRRVFTELPRATTVADIEALLPWATTADC